MRNKALLIVLLVVAALLAITLVQGSGPSI